MNRKEKNCLQEMVGKPKERERLEDRGLDTTPLAI